MNSKLRFLVLVLIAGLFAWVMADALFRSGMFAFRDAAHYYYPLFRFVADEWAAGRVPLWNPYENLGMPLAADPTASVFYPGKLIFALPLDYGWAYKIYVMAHLLLAALTAYRLARAFNASAAAAGVCAISYAFCGNVLFQYCNVVFLVGAAWLPLAMLTADRMLRGGERDEGRGDGGEGRGARDEGRGARDEGRGARDEGLGDRVEEAEQEKRPRTALRGGNPDEPSATRKRRIPWAIALGTVLALMVLGGDPQMAYNAGLLAAMYALWLWWDGSSLSLRQRLRLGIRRCAACVKRTKTKRTSEGERTTSMKISVRRTHPLVLLTLAAVTGLVLSAIQVLPSMEFAKHSGRTAQRNTGDLLAGRVERGTHAEHAYQFSVGPWRLPEYLWPNVSGRQFPVHRRWLDAIEAEGRIWTPSLYMGIFPLLLALSTMRFRRRKKSEPRGSPPRTSPPPADDTRIKWLTWSVLLAVVASFGFYGLGWLIQEIRVAAGHDLMDWGPLGGPFGGLYWLMTVLLPGYAYFRYPAKLLVVAALGLSVLAAIGWDRVLAGPSDRFRRGLLWLGGASLGGAITALAVRPFWHNWLSDVPPDVLFGPLDTIGAGNDLLWALGQTAVLCGLFWWLLRKGPSVRWVPAVALVLVAVDLGVANRWMIACAPSDLWEEPSELGTAIRREEQRRGVSSTQAPPRAFRHPIWMRPAWTRGGSRQRLAEAVRWDRDTLWPKYNLPAGIAATEVIGAMVPHDYEVFFSLTPRTAEYVMVTPDGCRIAMSSSKGLLADYMVLPGGYTLRGGERIEIGTEDVSLWRNPRHLPRAWIVHDVDTLPPLISDDPTEVWRRTDEVLYPDGIPRYLRRSAVIEAKTGETQEKGPGPFLAGESCRVTDYDPGRVEIEAELAEPGLVVLCDQFYPGWELQVEKRGQDPLVSPVLRTNRVMRGVWLPEGNYRLVYHYRPTSFLVGLVISGLGWAGLLLMAVVLGLRGSRQV